MVMSNHQELLSLIGAGWTTQIVHAAAELGIADILGDDAVGHPEVARRTGANPDAMHRLLMALCTINVCEETADRRFALAPMGQLLRADHPQTIRAWAIWWGTQMWSDWAGLLSSLRTGRSVRAQTPGGDGFAQLQHDERRAGVFHDAMAQLSRWSASELVQSYDLSRFRTVVDVGGGYGEFLLMLLEAFPNLRGTILDQSHAQAGAARRIAERGLAARCEFRAGDFFAHVPAGADVYLLKSVLHDWDDERCGVILSRCREAAGSTGRLLVVERVLPDRLEANALHRDAARSHLHMLLAHGARERTQEQMQGLLKSAGFVPQRELQLGTGLTLIEAAAPQVP
jgi:hypothetical protein